MENMVDNDNRYFVSTNFTTQYDQHAHQYNTHTVCAHAHTTHTLENDVIMPSTSSSSSFLYHDFRCHCHCWRRYTTTTATTAIVVVVVGFVIFVICSYPLCSPFTSTATSFILSNCCLFISFWCGTHHLLLIWFCLALFVFSCVGFCIAAKLWQSN